MKRIMLSTSIALLLVLAIAGASQAASAGKELLVKGTIETLETYVVNPPLMSVSASGQGAASQLGRFSFSYSLTVNLVTLEGSGATAEFVAANGDVIYAEGTGQATPTDADGVVNVVEHYTIIGGTGRFAGAGGTITFDRIVDTNTGLTSGTLNGEIELP